MASTGSKKNQEGPSQVAQPQASTSSAATPAQQKPAVKPNQELPALKPWMRQTVVLKLKEVDGRVPDMSEDVFCSKMLADLGFQQAETFSVQKWWAGIFYVTFASINICRRYWEMVKAAKPESPFTRFVAGCLIQREERRVTVSMQNPHTPGKDIATFLSRLCTVVKEPSQIMNGVGYWTGKWSVIVRLNRNPEAEDGLQHLPATFSLGSSPGFIYYPDMPQICRRCSKKGHQMKDCKEDACRNCRMTGHATKDCPKAKTCNLCGLADHAYRACPKRERSWATVAAKARGKPAPAPAAQKPKEPEKGKPKKDKKEGKRTAAPTPAPRPPPPARPPSPPRPSAPSRPSSPPRPSSPAPPRPSSPAPVTPTEESSFLFNPDSVALTPPPCPTLPPFSPGPAAHNPPPPAVLATPSLEEFPGLSSSGTLQRKRKVKDQAVAESSKKKIVEVCEAQPPENSEVVVEEEEMEQASVERREQVMVDLEADDSVLQYFNPNPVFDEYLEADLWGPGEPTGTKEEDPPDGSGN